MDAKKRQAIIDEMSRPVGYYATGWSSDGNYLAVVAGAIGITATDRSLDGAGRCRFVGFGAPGLTVSGWRQVRRGERGWAAALAGHFAAVCRAHGTTARRYEASLPVVCGPRAPTATP